MIQSIERDLTPDPVIENGYCIGCGACAAMPEKAYRMVETEHGTLVAQAVLDDVSAKLRAGKVCPFSDVSANEDMLGQTQFASYTQHHPKLGYWHNIYAGHVQAGAFRERGSSGGMGSWLSERLLASGMVDAIVHVKSRTAKPGELLFEYAISRSSDEVPAGAKSRYYPISLEGVIQTVLQQPGRYAFVGIPCFIKAVRLYAMENPGFSSCVRYCIGLVCGHLKSRGFAEFLGWQLGIPPDRLNGFDFRKKIEGRGANRYGAEAVGEIDGQQVSRSAPMQTLFGQDWGMGLFKPNACDYCDDVVAETADITIGDAWLPQYVNDSRGTNLIIVRHPDFVKLIEDGQLQAEIGLDRLEPDDAIRSQGSGYAHRREGLAYRLWLADQAGRWRPRKRVEAAQGLHGDVFERRHRLRLQLAQESHQAFLDAKQAGDIQLFFKRITPLAEQYRDLSRTPFKRLAARLRRWLRP
ncbi:MAG: hypothetical protein B7Y26_11615 [Hydrogenophilales bacterium 16-64-46]|nr:MAG: hypothetical protein B7Z32_11100 [Hydrogenophilales bacterium 12-64-13]OYZ04371.1 MAG: hypothetical protein B7Y26_11615 [Hydrogenophilales bacterium 16-64-46]OZA38264.1 MAG: hypothetical protein B7X87_07135 [Hydrogenophilales bacterium 17-64-34]HQS99169.1 Coenzyme F420 hydrogenase/dehydrogenase, beta subunit C-terminal domain [Thiobacillus sp.]